MSAGAHPRLRGADSNKYFEPNTDKGSSPLTRGGLNPILLLLVVAGLIPAYAGRTFSSNCYMTMLWAHPRLRGADTLPLS
ncbi:conserved hypothetical protein [Corynebacterium striatum]|nr:conserved hypothetical protein [Corynebacterium striatum]